MADFETIGVEVTQRGARKTQQDLDGVTKSAQGTTRAFRNAEQASRGKAKADRDGTRATRDADKAQDRFNKTLTRSSGRLKVIGRDINRYFILPMTAMIGLSARAALTLNEGMGNVQALIPDTGERIYELRDSVTDLASATGKSFDDITSGLYRTISVFQDNAETVDRLNTAIEVGIAGYASTAESVQLLSSVTRSYGDTSAEAVNKVADLAFETVRLGDTTIPQLASAMQVATDRAVRLGISQEELFATMSTLTGITGDASMVATQFRSAMDSLLNPTDAFTALMETMGYSTAEAAIEGEGMIGVLKAVADEAERTGRPLQDYITRKEGITLVSRLAGEQLGDFAFRLGEIEQSTGAANEAFTNVTEGVNKYGIEIQKGRQRINSFMAEIGDNLLPVLSNLLQIVGDLIEAFAMLPDRVQRSTVALTGIAGAMSILLQIAGAIKQLKIVSVMGGIGRAVATTTGISKTFLGVAALIGGAATAIAGAAALVGMAWVRNQRLAEEAAESHIKRMERLQEVQEEIMDTARASERAYSAARLAARTGMQTEGGLPTYRTDDQGTLSQMGTMSISYLEELPEEEIDRLIEDYEEKFQKLNDGIISGLENQEQNLQSRIGPAMEGFERLIDNMVEEHGPRGFNRWIENRVPGIDADLFGENLSENLDEIWPIIRDYYEELESLTRPGAVDIQRMEELGPMYRALSAIVPNQEQLNSVKGNIREQEGILIDLDAALDILKGIGEGASDVSESVGEDWREIFTRVTGVTLEATDFGAQAAQAYADYVDMMQDRNRAFVEAVGGQVDELKLAQDSMSRALSDMEELLVDEGSTFSLDDVLFGGETRSGDVIADHLIATFDSLREDALSELRKEIDAVNDSSSDLWKSIDSGTASVNDIESGIADYETVLERAESLQSALLDYGIEDPAVLSIVDTLTDSILQLNEALDETGEKAEALTFSQARSKLIDFGEFTKEVLFEAFGNGMEDAWDRATEKLDDGLTDAEKIETIWADLVGDVLMEAGSAMIDTVDALGASIGKIGGLGEDFAQSMGEILVSIGETIPALMIQAGLMAMVNGQWGLGLALLGMGIAGQFASGFARGMNERENEESSGTQMNAKGRVINTPVTFNESGQRNVAGEAGWEGILPLAQNTSGELGVKAMGGGSEVNVNVYNQAGSDVEVEERDDGEGNIELYVKRAVKRVVGGGGIDKELRTRYGIRSVQG